MVMFSLIKTCQIEPLTFEVAGLKLVGGIAKPKKYRDKHKGILYIPGAPRTASEKLTSKYADETIPKLCKLGFSVFVFKFPGTGDSEGRLELNSLSLRLKVAAAAYDKLIMQDQLMKDHIGVNATSIAGHIACRLTELRPVKGLVLDAPAAYGKEAEDKLWNGEFTEAIRKPDSWSNSPAFTALEKFTGHTLLVYSEHDEVIPLPIQNEYKRIVTTKKDEVVLLQEAGHQIHLDNSKGNKNARKVLADKSESFFVRYL